MSCRTCDHTMQGLGKVVGGLYYFWCPYCGTLKGEYRDEDNEQMSWSPPAGWGRAIDVLLRLEPLALAADNILRDCHPERKEA